MFLNLSDCKTITKKISYQILFKIFNISMAIYTYVQIIYINLLIYLIKLSNKHKSIEKILYKIINHCKPSNNITKVLSDNDVITKKFIIFLYLMYNKYDSFTITDLNSIFNYKRLKIKYKYNNKENVIIIKDNIKNNIIKKKDNDTSISNVLFGQIYLD